MRVQCHQCDEFMLKTTQSEWKWKTSWILFELTRLSLLWKDRRVIILTKTRSITDYRIHEKMKNREFFNFLRAFYARIEFMASSNHKFCSAITDVEWGKRRSKRKRELSTKSLFTAIDFLLPLWGTLGGFFFRIFPNSSIICSFDWSKRRDDFLKFCCSTKWMYTWLLNRWKNFFLEFSISQTSY